MMDSSFVLHCAVHGVLARIESESEEFSKALLNWHLTCTGDFCGRTLRVYTESDWENIESLVQEIDVQAADYRALRRELQETVRQLESEAEREYVELVMEEYLDDIEV